MKRGVLLPVVVVGVLVAGLGIGTQAAADPVSTRAGGAVIALQPLKHSVKLTAKMQIVGFDAAVAKAHGYVIRTNAAGLSYSVKAGVAPSAVKPDSNPIEYGNCGDSYIYYKYAGRRSKSPHYQATYDTGYNVIDDAFDGTWVVDFVDHDGVGRVTMKYAANGTPSWSNAGTTFHTPTGYSYAEVSTGSEAILDDGVVCKSVGPWDSTELG